MNTNIVKSGKVSCIRWVCMVLLMELIGYEVGVVKSLTASCKTSYIHLLLCWSKIHVEHSTWSQSFSLWALTFAQTTQVEVTWHEENGLVCKPTATDVLFGGTEQTNPPKSLRSSTESNRLVQIFYPSAVTRSVLRETFSIVRFGMDRISGRVEDADGRAAV